MRIDTNKSRIQPEETQREKALRQRVEMLEARLAKLEGPKEPAPEVKP